MGRSRVPNPPAITTAFIPPFLLAAARESQNTEESGHYEIPEREREKEKEQGAGAHDPPIDAVGEAASPRGHGEADEQVPDGIGQDVPGEEQGDSRGPQLLRDKKVAQADRGPPDRPVGVRNRRHDAGEDRAEKTRAPAVAPPGPGSPLPSVHIEPKRPDFTDHPHRHPEKHRPPPQ